ncbi:MAG TPA: response regulator, partial [Blastocatellia bacterium]
MPTVLVVDDEPNIRWTMAELLKREGYETLTSSDFDSAISLIESSMPDAAVVDIVLSGRSGIEFLKEVSNRDSYIPVIMITGEPNVSQIPEIVRAGAYDFIPKPVVKDVLLRAVSKAVEKKRLVDQKNKLEQQIKRHAEELEVLVQERTRELAEAHNFLNAVLDSSTEYAIIATDIEGRIVLFNRGAELMLGYSFEQMRTSPAGVLFQDESYRTAARPFHKHYQEASAPGGSRLEVEMVRSDGTAFTASAAITQILSSSDQLIGYLSVIKDLTEEREHEEAMRQMQARLARNEKISALGRMAALVAHEVRNPLAGLRLYSLHLRGKVTGKLAPAEVSLIDKIINGINHL